MTFAKRISNLRATFSDAGVTAFYIPKVDMFMGENIRPRDERLTWISGFTGSAGFAVVTRTRAMLFVDSRYIIQARQQCPDFEVLLVPDSKLGDGLDADDILGIDGWVITSATCSKLKSEPFDIKLTYNLIDEIWDDRPDNNPAPMTQLGIEYTGIDHQTKINNMATEIGNMGLDGFFTNHPANAAWLLNIRGGEVAGLPAPLVFILLTATGEAHIFGIDAPDFDLGENVKFHAIDDVVGILANAGKIGYDADMLPVAARSLIANQKPVTDPIMAAKASKSKAEIQASRDAHLADALAMISHLHWLDNQNPSDLDEIKSQVKLAEFRADHGSIEASFDTISGFNANGAIIHYRADELSNAPFTDLGVYLLDSGGQFKGATTDITRTIAIGDGLDDARSPFTAVLAGLAAISTLRFPVGLTGRDIDAHARAALWAMGLDYGHGTGHGVGAGLSVHEGPASISRRSNVPLAAGMILSLEPGYYLEGAFGIRLENLAVLHEVDGFMHFETLTFVPFDRRLLDMDALDTATREWLNDYHNQVWDKLSPHVEGELLRWLSVNTSAI